MEYILIIVSAIFVNNILLAQFLGICPFLGVSNKLSTATGMSGAVCFVITLATVVTYLLNQYLLVPFGLDKFMQTIVFILVIAALVQMVEIVLKKISPSLYQALGIFLPLITTNCAVLGVAITVVTKEFSFGGSAPHLMNLGEATVYAFATSLGYGLAMILFAGLREHLAGNDVPKLFKGLPIALVTVSIMAMAFLGFSGMV
ncbi:MAG: RnfABCDGE type electron transport complex subunit A [Bacteroidales bacterium]|nr:RnfABCDGE type electron transport complex subunit A [Bacteroidales bacterium]